MKPLGETWRALRGAELCVAAFVFGSSVAAAQPESSPPATGPRRLPEVRVLARHGWSSPIGWLGATHVGLLHVVAADSLFTFDLLDGARRLGAPVYLPAGWGGLHPLPIPASNVVVVPRARRGLSTGAAPPGRSVASARTRSDTLSSYAIDAFTGTVLWERAPLPRGLALIHMPEAGVLLECQEDEPVVRAIDLASGEVLWETGAEAWQVRPRGGYVDVIGEAGRLLDGRTGRTVLGYRLPIGRSEDIAPLRSPDRIVVREGRAILGYRLPSLPHEAAESAAAAMPRDTALQPTWRWDLPRDVDADCLEEARVPLPRDLLVVRSLWRSYLLDGVTGRPLWQGGDGRTQFAVSPDLESVAALTGSRLVLVDVDSGAAHVQSVAKACSGARGKVRTLAWLNEDQVLLCCAESSDRMTGMSVLSQSRGTLWQSGATFPHAQFVSTSDEKVAGALVGALKMVAVSAAVVAPYASALGALGSATTIPGVLSAVSALSMAPGIALAQLAGLSLLFRVIESRASLRLHDQVMLWPFADTQVGLTPPVTGPTLRDDMAALAWRRFQADVDSSVSAKRGTRIGVAGAENRYEVVEQDFLTPAQRTLAVYRHKGVNGMGFLLPHRIALTVEDDERAVAILWFGDGEPPSALPELLPPRVEGPRDASPR